jgi:hypothetical protein
MIAERPLDALAGLDSRVDFAGYFHCIPQSVRPL